MTKIKNVKLNMIMYDYSSKEVELIIVHDIVQYDYSNEEMELYLCTYDYTYSNEGMHSLTTWFKV